MEDVEVSVEMGAQQPLQVAPLPQPPAQAPMATARVEIDAGVGPSPQPHPHTSPQGAGQTTVRQPQQQQPPPPPTAEEVEGDDFAPQLAPPTRGDVQALMLRLEAMERGVPPDPTRVCGHDGEAQLHPLQLVSHTRFLEMSIEAGPTASAVHKAAAQFNTDTELVAMKRLMVDTRPRSDDPMAMSSALPLLSPKTWEEVTVGPRVQHPAPGVLQTVDPAGFASLHREHCRRCKERRPCYAPPLAQALGGFPLPITGGSLPPSAHRTTPYPAIFDPELAAKAKQLLSEGSYKEVDPSAIRHYSPCHNAPKHSTKLSAEQRKVCEEGGTLGAFQVAQSLSLTFQTAYAAGLGAGPQPPGPTQVRRAWEKASAASGGVTKPRLVQDMSRMTDSFTPCGLIFQPIEEFMQHIGEGSWIIKTDVSQGYFHIPLDEESKQLCGTTVVLEEGAAPTHIRAERLAMGCHPAALIFSLVTAEGVTWLRVQGYDSAGVYIDDFYLVSPTKEEALQALASLRTTSHRLGLDLSEEKTDGPAQQMVVRGYYFDTVRMTVELPPEKQAVTLALAQTLLWAAKTNTPVPEPALAELGGRLTWWATMDPSIASHTRTLARWGKYVLDQQWQRWSNQQHYWGTDKPAQVAELTWLLKRAQAGSLMGSRIITKTLVGKKVVVFAIDATGENALGIVSELGALRVNLPGCSTMSIPVLELLSTVFILKEYGHLLAGVTIYIGCDAQGACYWVNKGKAYADCPNDLLRLISAAEEYYGVLVIQRWLTRWRNYKADRVAALSIAQAQALLKLEYIGEVTAMGRPDQFLSDWASKVYPGFQFTPTVWEVVSNRE